jgi:KDO2-lipid IV(A) lauroyltransferase
MPKIGLWLRRGRRRLSFLAMRSLVRATGFARARRLGQLIGDLQFCLAWRDRRRQTRDMALVLGQLPDDPTVRALLREAYRVNTAAVLEILAMFDRHQDEQMLASQSEIEGLPQLQAALAGGRGAILLGAHMGNEALLVVRLACSGWPVSVVYRQSRMMSAGFFDRGLALYGIEGILANEGFRAYVRMVDALRRGRIVFLTMDQGTKFAQDGIVMRFLGKEMPMPAGPAQLARLSGAPVLPVVTIASDPVWRFAIDAPVPRTAGATLASDVEELARVTERQVLQYPHLWSWHHRRWCKYPFTPATGNSVSILR